MKNLGIKPAKTRLTNPSDQLKGDETAAISRHDRPTAFGESIEPRDHVTMSRALAEEIRSTRNDFRVAVTELNALAHFGRRF